MIHQSEKNKDHRREIRNLESRIENLYVLINTLQTNLESILTYVDKDKLLELETPSLKWCRNWKEGDEK